MNEVFCVYVEPGNPNTIAAVRCYTTDAAVVLADSRDTILVKFRRPDGQGGWFTDELYGSGWKVVQPMRYKGKNGKPDGLTLTRSRPKVGSTSAEARDIHYDDDGSSGRQVLWPTGTEQSPVGGSGRLRFYDEAASDYSTLLAQARALNPDNTPITLP